MITSIIVCIFAFIIVFVAKKRLDRSIFNDYTLFIGPYVIIMLVNNIIMTKVTTFYEMNELTINAITTATVSFGFGTIVGSVTDSKIIRRWSELKKDDAFSREEISWKIRSATRYTLFVLLIQGIDYFLRLSRYGIFDLSQNDFKRMQIQGFSGHLFLTLYAIVPINLYMSIKKRYKLGIISVIITALFFFLTFVKYNVIVLILMTALYYIIRDKKKLRKILIATAVLIVVAFVGNYIVIFVTQGHWGKDVIIYTFEHLWMYIVCGVSMMNYTIGNFAVHYSIKDFLIDSISAMPNMLLAPFTGMRISSGNGFKSLLDTVPIFSSSGQRGNGLSVLAILYSNGENGIGFVLTMIIIGLICSKIMHKVKYNSITMTSLTGVLFFTFLLISFFGNYWTLSTPWEMLIYTLIFPIFFDSHHRIRIVFSSHKP